MGLRLGVDQVRLLAELRLGNVGILAEMQLLEFLVLLIAVRLDNGGDKEPLQCHAVVSEVRNQQLMDALGKCGEMLINFKNIVALDFITWAI